MTENPIQLNTIPSNSNYDSNLMNNLMNKYVKTNVPKGIGNPDVEGRVNPNDYARRDTGYLSHYNHKDEEELNTVERDLQSSSEIINKNFLSTYSNFNTPNQKFKSPQLGPKMASTLVRDNTGRATGIEDPNLQQSIPLRNIPKEKYVEYSRATGINIPMEKVKQSSEELDKAFDETSADETYAEMKETPSVKGAFEELGKLYNPNLSEEEIINKQKTMEGLESDNEVKEYLKHQQVLVDPTYTKEEKQKASERMKELESDNEVKSYKITQKSILNPNLSEEEMKQSFEKLDKYSKTEEFKLFTSAEKELKQKGLFEKSRKHTLLLNEMGIVEGEQTLNSVLSLADTAATKGKKENYQKFLESKGIVDKTIQSDFTKERYNLQKQAETEGGIIGTIKGWGYGTIGGISAGIDSLKSTYTNANINIYEHATPIAGLKFGYTFLKEIREKESKLEKKKIAQSEWILSEGDYNKASKKYDEILKDDESWWDKTKRSTIQDITFTEGITPDELELAEKVLRSPAVQLAVRNEGVGETTFSKRGDTRAVKSSLSGFSNFEDKEAAVTGLLGIPKLTDEQLITWQTTVGEGPQGSKLINIGKHIGSNVGELGKRIYGITPFGVVTNALKGRKAQAELIEYGATGGTSRVIMGGVTVGTTMATVVSAMATSGLSVSASIPTITKESLVVGSLAGSGQYAITGDIESSLKTGIGTGIATFGIGVGMQKISRVYGDIKKAQLQKELAQSKIKFVDASGSTIAQDTIVLDPTKLSKLAAGNTDDILLGTLSRAQSKSHSLSRGFIETKSGKKILDFDVLGSTKSVDTTSELAFKQGFKGSNVKTFTKMDLEVISYLDPKFVKKYYGLKDTSMVLDDTLEGFYKSSADDQIGIIKSVDSKVDISKTSTKVGKIKKAFQDINRPDVGFSSDIKKITSSEIIDKKVVSSIEWSPIDKTNIKLVDLDKVIGLKRVGGKDYIGIKTKEFIPKKGQIRQGLSVQVADTKTTIGELDSSFFKSTDNFEAAELFKKSLEKGKSIDARSWSFSQEVGPGRFEQLSITAGSSDDIIKTIRSGDLDQIYTYKKAEGVFDNALPGPKDSSNIFTPNVESTISISKLNKAFSPEDIIDDSLSKTWKPKSKRAKFTDITDTTTDIKVKAEGEIFEKTAQTEMVKSMRGAGSEYSLGKQLEGLSNIPVATPPRTPSLSIQNIKPTSLTKSTSVTKIVEDKPIIKGDRPSEIIKRYDNFDIIKSDQAKDLTRRAKEFDLMKKPKEFDVIKKPIQQHQKPIIDLPPSAPIVPPIPFFFRTPAPAPERQKRSRSKSKKKTKSRYAPSLTARGLGIKGKKPRGVLTGLELRPITRNKGRPKTIFATKNTPTLLTSEVKIKLSRKTKPKRGRPRKSKINKQKSSDSIKGRGSIKDLGKFKLAKDNNNKLFKWWK